MNEALVAAQDVSFGYARTSVLDHVTLRVAAGELVALLGPNGAGKSTLLKLLAGLLHPRAGSVTTAAHRSHSVAYLAQTEPLPLDYCARDVVWLGRLPYGGFWGRQTERDHHAVERAMERTATLELAERPVGTLSGGEQQRVALARALAQEPRALLLDEPTNHLDIRHQADLLSLLRAETSRGLGVLMVVHDLNLAACAHRCLLLAGGRVVADGTPEHVLEAGRLRQVYGTPVEVVATAGGRFAVVPILERESC